MRFTPFLALALALGGAGVAGGWWAMHGSNAEAEEAAAADGKLEGQLAEAGIDARQRGAIEALVHSYILEHPEILPEAMEKLQARETEARLAPLRGAVETPFPGAVMGNPQGKITLVEFTDFACTYCRSSVADVEALVKANPDLKVVVRELPIIAPESEPAARMGLAAAAQGKYAAFHKAMFSGERPSSTSIAAAASAAGLDSAAAGTFTQTPGVHQELERNLGLARQLGISGTPAWSVGGKLLTGAIGREALQQAVDAARKG
ncbi:DsbA family protein [Novosphingobium sp. PASSN1]|uniref:DsbA family protein n=1 Tax=Novosphingobium sp. PASSN1 TaxID=2015561 RepID=UPI0025D94105|nr:DsbA family protein [Novosphingobium sp. PASSN1]